MAKARSPSYPAIGLATAVEKVTAVYNKDVQNSIPREVVAKHAGYSGINGNSLSMLSSLLKYGLLTGRGDNTSVSDLALQIIAHPSGTAERQAAIRAAAFSPSLFAEILDHFKGAKVSDDALRSYLLTRKFLPSAVEGVIRAYRETMTLVETETGGYAMPVAEPLAGSMPQAQSPVAPQPMPPGRGMNMQPILPMTTVPGPMSVSFNGDSLQVSAILEDSEAVDKLIKALTATKALLPEKRP